MTDQETDELHGRVEPDDALSGDEKETTITMYGTDKQFTIHSAKPTVVRSLLQHDHFTVRWIQGRDGRGVLRKVSTRQQAREVFETIHALAGEMPVGCLTVKSKPRSNDHQSSIVSHETVSADAWEDSDD